MEILNDLASLHRPGKGVSRKNLDYLERVAAEDQAADGRKGGPCVAFEEIRREPLHSASELEGFIKQATSARKARWRDEG